MDNFNAIKSYKEKQNMKSKDNMDHSCMQAGINRYSFMPSMSFGINNFLPLHIDKDLFLSVLHVHSDFDLTAVSSAKYPLHSGIVKYFAFDNAVSVGVQSGDLLIFNPTINHCISTSSENYSNNMNYCISHYFKTAIASRNDNSIKFEHK